jgi:hypothetical protein
MKEFINPYHFISIDQKVFRQPVRSWTQNASLTGYIDCDLLTLSPIFIPNTSNDSAFPDEARDIGLKSYDFFSYRNLAYMADCRNVYSRPIIPGSSVRGVVRSAYEAAFNGCLSQLDPEDKAVLYRRTAIPKNPGLLEYDQSQCSWTLYSAERVRADLTQEKTGITIDTGDRVYFSREKGKNVDKAICIRRSQFNGSDQGYALKGQAFVKKKYNSIMVRRNLEIKQVPQEAIDRLRKVLELYNDKTVNKTHDGYKAFGRLIDKKQPIPIFYKSINDVLYMSPACITKEVFRNNIRGLLEAQGEHHPCKKTDKICESCALFGLVGEDGDSLSSRISFGDAVPCDAGGSRISADVPHNQWKDWYLKPCVLPELSYPKTSSVEFYTIKPSECNTSEWNYDYYKMAKNQYKIENAALRGRKMYWHNSNQIALSQKATSDRQSVVRPVLDNKRFSMRITFSDISKKELCRLLWVLSFGDESCAHKIGRGKPLGFGSVRLLPTSVKLRAISMQDGMIIRSLSDFDFSGEVIQKEGVIPSDQKSLKELRVMAQYPGPGTNEVPVDYPRIKIDGSIYEWFTANRKPRNQMQVLPNIALTGRQPGLRRAEIQRTDHFQSGSDDRSKRNREGRPSEKRTHRGTADRHDRNTHYHLPQNRSNSGVSRKPSPDADRFQSNSPFSGLGRLLENEAEKE